MAALATRPISTTFLADSLAPSTSSDLFTTHGVAAAPFLFPAPPHFSVSGPPSAPFYSRSAGVHDDHPRSIVAVLTHRIRDLEGALREEREAHEAALEANGAFADDAAAMQAEILELRRELLSALAAGGQGPSASSSAESDGQLHTSALAAECARLRGFIGVMLAAGEPKPVVQSAYDRVLEGEEPEAALVAAIKQAVAQPGNVWRQLLDPVTGVRTRDDYLAQVRCTLSARAQTQDWRKRAKFWKQAAKEDERHGETVTPSVSAISAVIDALPQERRERVDEFLGKMEAGGFSLRVARTAIPQADSIVARIDEVLQEWTVPDGEPVSVPESTSAASSSSSANRSDDVQAMADVNTSIVEESTSAPAEIRLPASSSSMVLPATRSTSPTRMFAVHSNLPPLASEMFRASHSIKTLSSRGSRRSALGTHMVTSPTGESSLGLGVRDSGNNISASASASTQNSTKSRYRRTKVVAVPVVATCAPTTTTGALVASIKQKTSRWSFFGPSRSATSATSVVVHEEEVGSVPVEAARGTSTSTEALPAAYSDSPSHDTPSFDCSVETAVEPEDLSPRTPNRLSPPRLPKALLDFGSSPDDDLVLVLHSDFSGSSYHTTMQSPPASPTRPVPGAGLGSAHTTPEKRSRLPVRMPGMRAIKRFSASINISRPVLVDTTNAGTFAFSAAPRQAPVVQKGAGTGGGGRARAPSAAGTSPPRPSKIPMGRKLNRFGLGGQV
ncbi:hypothetical protein TRAPUB_471 [Trametes pubescens]|uniref:Uncharacterized protein n=1 Tax=Trametes pubescens TaxID=154538 RepID=A0A1M2VM52_TRAPU|nr:hypothetical protein TRAPUB_471 [Trametes pubescens]